MLLSYKRTKLVHHAELDEHKLMIRTLVLSNDMKIVRLSK